MSVAIFGVCWAVASGWNGNVGPLALLVKFDLKGKGLERLKEVSNRNTPWKIDMEPKHGGLEDDFPFETGDSQVPC